MRWSHRVHVCDPVQVRATETTDGDVTILGNQESVMLPLDFAFDSGVPRDSSAHCINKPEDSLLSPCTSHANNSILR